jgi:hypothetical protein
MPEKSEPDTLYYVVTERAAGAPQPLSRPGPNAAKPKWPSPLVHTWLTSEYVNAADYFRFEAGAPVYEAANWPLGLPFQPRTDAEQSILGMLDLQFDHHARWAIGLPWRCTGLSLAIHPRPEEAALVICNIGHWNGEPERYQDIVSTLARRRRVTHPEIPEHVAYAITPFCVIGQTWREEYGPFPAHALDTRIALFYTFETFIQECLAIDARRAGVPADEIIQAYEHQYANVTPHPHLMLRDPTQMRLARYGNPAIDWSLIGATPENVTGGGAASGWQARGTREQLFFYRLQTHLMVAIAAALHGVATFANGHAQSALVGTATRPPALDALAPHWLGHLLGGYDHAAACADLLESLAAHYGQVLSGEPLRGMSMPRFRGPRDEIEQGIAMALGPFSRDCQVADPVDMFRWNLFEATLDDASVMRWSESTHRWLRNWVAG